MVSLFNTGAQFSNPHPCGNDRLLGNIEWLAKIDPLLSSELARPLSRRFYKPVKERGRVINLEMGGSRLYELDARKHASAELKAYFASNRKYISAPSSLDRPSAARSSLRQDDSFQRDIISVLLRDERAHASARDVATKQRSLLVVFGLGLGYHIAPLLKRLRPCNICIVETRKESFYYSACTHDFARWHRLCRERNGSLSFIVQEDVDSLEKLFSDFLRHRMHFFADSFFFYRHAKATASMERLYSRLLDILHNSTVNIGFFEDQIRMLSNSRKNLMLSPSTVILEPKIRYRPKREALIIANGPSLDDSLPYLSSLCVGRVIFSCGSALFTLLKNGIVPDYHCEIENVFPEFNHITKALEDGYCLDDVTLLAAMTVQNDIVAAFRKRILFFRELTPFSYLSEHESLSNIAPTVSNTTFSCANAMGFSKQYFLGVDMGYKAGRSHHAKDAVHFIYKNLATGQERLQEDSPLLFRGNFGGYVRSQIVFHVSKQMLEVEAQGHRLNNFYNCSDGAALKGFIPLLPTLIERLPACASKEKRDLRLLDNLCARVSLADESFLSRIENAETQHKFFATAIAKILKPIALVDSLIDLQDVHNLLKELFFDDNKVVGEGKNKDMRSFLLSFYVGTVFIFFRQVHNCFIRVSHKRWCRLRAGIGTHIQRRLQRMEIELRMALAQERAHIAVARDRLSEETSGHK